MLLLYTCYYYMNPYEPRSRHRFHIDTSPVMPSTAPCHPIAGPRAPRPPLPAAAARQSAARRPAGPRRSSRGGDHRLRGWLSHGFWEFENWRKLGYTGIIKWDLYEGNGDVGRYTQEPAKHCKTILFDPLWGLNILHRVPGMVGLTSLTTSSIGRLRSSQDACSNASPDSETAVRTTWEMDRDGWCL